MFSKKRSHEKIVKRVLREKNCWKKKKSNGQKDGKEIEQKNKVKKLISAPTFRLKGGGWYETDFKTGSKKNIVDNKDEKNSQPKEKNKKTNKLKNKSSDKKLNQEK